MAITAEEVDVLDVLVAAGGGSQPEGRRARFAGPHGRRASTRKRARIRQIPELMVALRGEVAVDLTGKATVNRSQA